MMFVHEAVIFIMRACLNCCKVWGRSGAEIVALVEVLSKKKFSGKVYMLHASAFLCSRFVWQALKLPDTDKPLSRIVLMEQIKRALDFGWESGVEATLKPSPEVCSS